LKKTENNINVFEKNYYTKGKKVIMNAANTFCRCCMMADVDLFHMKKLQFQYNGHTIQLFDTFWECSGVARQSVLADIDADARICLNCKLQLESVHNFRAICKKTDQALQTAFATEPKVASSLTMSIMTPVPGTQEEVKLVKTEYELTTSDYYAMEQPMPSTSAAKPEMFTPSPALAAAWSASNPPPPTAGPSKAERKILCKKCGEISETVDDHEEHETYYCVWRPLEYVDEQTQRRKFQCRKCMKSYAAKISFQQHVRTDHKKIRFTCPVCDREFKSRHGLRSHIVTHTQDYPYVCPVEECAYRGAQSYAFKVHLQNHHNIKSFEEIGKIE
jgi:Zinc finger, C2H2 type